MATKNNGRDPRHVAVILDGNGRWAEQHGLPHTEGHRAGAKRVVDLLNNMEQYDVKYVTLYAFSAENWNRPKEEVDALMSLLVEFIEANLDMLISRRIRLLATGRLTDLPPLCQEKLQTAFKKTEHFTERTLVLALNYGGRAEITDAVKAIVKQVLEGNFPADAIKEETISANLYLPEVPDPDLLIRTAGEQRLSNFLLWELSYAEFYFTPVYWPDFDSEELKKAMDAYYNRDRRFGGRQK